MILRKCSCCEILSDLRRIIQSCLKINFTSYLVEGSGLLQNFISLLSEGSNNAFLRAERKTVLRIIKK